MVAKSCTTKRIVVHPTNNPLIIVDHHGFVKKHNVLSIYQLLSCNLFARAISRNQQITVWLVSCFHMFHSKIGMMNPMTNILRTGPTYMPVGKGHL